jgi:cellobiose-specific phosphotransferase system component IIB
MATIVLVCAAGVSGTFLARRIAPSLPDVEFIVTTEHALDTVVAAADGVLLAPHLASAEEAIRVRVAPIPVAVLPAAAMTPAGSILAVDAVDALVQSLPDSALQRSTEDV